MTLSGCGTTRYDRASTVPLASVTQAVTVTVAVSVCMTQGSTHTLLYCCCDWSYMAMKAGLLLTVTFPFVIALSACAFQTRTTSRTTRERQLLTKIFSAVSIERTAIREIGEFQNWAVLCGVQPENGFCLVESDVNDGDWRSVSSSGTIKDSRVLFVPSEMIFSASITAQEFDGYVNGCLQTLQKKGFAHLIPEFLLFLKVIIEYERGEQSPYYPWFSSLPRKWNTGSAMDDFCLSCLPPYLKKLCLEERSHLSAFRDALKEFNYLGDWAKANEELSRFIYNVVLTRSFKSQDGDRKLVPGADMLNHGYPSNVALNYDSDGNCHVICTRDIRPGEDLVLDYGHTTNPSKLFATYGFLFQSPATYCKILHPSPSKELVAVGYSPEKLVFGTQNGEIAPSVWDVLLYSRLETRSASAKDRNAFFQAHINGDQTAKALMHQKYFKETCSALLLHVDNILAEVDELTLRTNSFDSIKHPRLPLIRRHNQMVIDTFQKVKANINENFMPMSG